MTPTNGKTNKELLIRIDERQQQILKDVSAIKKQLSSKVDNDEDYAEVKHRVEGLWDWRNKVLGTTVIIGAAAGAAISWVFNQFGR